MTFVSRKRLALGLPLAVMMLAGCAGPVKTTSWRSGSDPWNLELPPVGAPASVDNQPQTSRKPLPQDQNEPVPDAPLVIRNQNANSWQQELAPDGSDRTRYPMASSGSPSSESVPPRSVRPVQFTDPATQSPADLWGLSSGPTHGHPVPQGPNPSAPNGQAMPQAPPGQVGPNGYLPPPSAAGATPPVGTFPTQVIPPNGQAFPPIPPPTPPFVGPDGPVGGMLGVPSPITDIIVNVQETQTGRFMLGAAVNSSAGVTGQIVIDEKNFDWRRVPTSLDDVMNGTAFRGGGQGLRVEALPGSIVQRYMLQFTEPYLFNTHISMNASGFIYNRRYFDWDEQRLGGRLGLGYRITPDLSLSTSVRAEQINIRNPRVLGVPELDAAVGDNDLYSGRVTLIQDTRDIPFQPTQGYYLETSFEQVFGTYDYSRAEVDFRRYFLMAERPDGSGRHVLGFSNRAGFSGTDTPIFENYFAGGYSTLRGFDFRRASPQSGGVTVGGRFQFLGSVEYLFPITADDMLKGVAFFDYGTVEEDIEINVEDYRVSVGLGLRIFVPAMGPAPIALDFAIPLAREDTDEIRQFSFFIGVSR